MVRRGTRLAQLVSWVRLAQVVEQWTGNPEVEGSSPPSNHLIFGYLRYSY